MTDEFNLPKQTEDDTTSLAAQIEAVRLVLATAEWSGSLSDPVDRRNAAALRAALTTLEANQWRPIETAPKDGEWLLTCIAGTIIPFVAAYDDEPGVGWSPLAGDLGPEVAPSAALPVA